MELGYDKTASIASTTSYNPQYNGNIEGTVWKSRGDELDGPAIIDNLAYTYRAEDVQQSIGAYQKLPGDNNRDMMSSSFVITIDQNGVFTGVKQGDKTYTVAEWNKMMQAKPLVKNDEKNFPAH